MSSFTDFLFGKFSSQPETTTTTEAPVSNVTVADVSMPDVKECSQTECTQTQTECTQTQTECAKTECTQSQCAQPQCAQPQCAEMNSGVEVTFANLGSLVGKCDDNICSFLEDQTNMDIVKALNTDLPVESCKCLLRELTARWNTIDNCDLDEMSFETFCEFLTTTDYNHSEVSKNEQVGLEDFLGKMIFFFFKKRPDATSEQFRTLFNMLRVELISPMTFGEIVTLDQCKVLRQADHSFSERLLDMFANKALAKPFLQKNRFPEKKIELSFEQKLTPLVFSQLSVGMKVDAMDSHGDWFTARVVEKTDTETYGSCVKVTFDGFGKGCDEQITQHNHEQKPRLSVFGSMTGGTPHAGGNYGPHCKCVTCTKMANSPSCTCAICASMNKYGDNVAMDLLTKLALSSILLGVGTGAGTGTGSC